MQKKTFLTTTYEYDKNGNVIKIITPEGYEIIREYDLLDRITKETHIDKTSGIERTTEYRYDKADNPVEEIDSRGSIRRSYDLQNQMTEQVDREGNSRRFQYDKNGNIIKVIHPSDCHENGEEGESYTFTYDNMGRLESVRNALGFLEEQNEYDANGNLIRKRDALGTLVEYTYDIANRQKNIWTGEALKTKNQTESLENNQLSAIAGKPSQTYTYDARGNITGITDGEGNRTSYDLDAWGRITTIHKPDGSKETYKYDFAGNITAATDGNGNTIQYHFNSMNKLEEIVDQNGEKETFTYDSQGRMASHTDRNRGKTTYGYNMDNQLRFKRAQQLETTEIQAIKSRKTVPITLENKYSYNDLGQLTEASGGGVVYSYTYTPNGNVMDKLVNGSKELSYTYISSGKVASIADKSGKKTTYQYNKAGRVLSVSENGKTVAEYSYYEDGNLRQVRFANGVETNYAYNADKNYKNIVTKTADGEILLDYSYQYDGNGNRIQKIGADHVTKHAGNDSSIGTTTYTYDSLQRLREVSYPTGEMEQFQYDNAGNRILKKYGAMDSFRTGSYLEECYQYDNRNRLVERTNPKTVTYYQYDKQGNTVSELTKRFLKPETTKVQQADGRTLVSNRLAKTELEQYKTYEYNAFNQTSKVTVEEYLESSKEIHVQENLDNGDYHYYHQNEHGDIEYITGKDGKIENVYTYDAFGNITNSAELVKNRYTYNGEQYDQVTQQYYLRARYYNSLVGRFTQEDVYRGDGLNLYAYCGNKPVMYVDPSGYAWENGTENPLFIDTPPRSTTYTDSTALKNNMLAEMGVSQGSYSTDSHQAQHIIPQEVYKNSSFLQENGFNLGSCHNGIFDVNMNNSSTSSNTMLASNGVSGDMINRYVSENTNHSGYHKLYSNAVQQQVDSITKNMDSRRKQLALLGYKGAKLDSIIKKESRTAISNLVDELRVMNQDGIDMYKKNKGSGAEYSSQEEYNRYFDEELKKAKKKCGH